jgi:S-adenosyl methyltransferase
MSRVYDYLLGGSHNFAADRALANDLTAAMPQLPVVLHANRAFLHRAVRFLLDCGIRQFLDLGSGLPTAGAVHEVTHRVDPGARVVYVDVDPIAVAYAHDHLADDGRVAAVCADLREPEQVLSHPDTRRLVDLSQPVGLLTVAVLHFVPDADDPAGLVAAYRDAVAPGSHWVLSHATADGATPPGLPSAAALTGRTSTPLTTRTYAQIIALMDGFEPVPPGLVRIPDWRPEPGDQAAEAVGDAFPGYAAVARRPGPPAEIGRPRRSPEDSDDG